MVQIHLSPIKHTYERSVFTFMMVLGEIGGIYGAIASIPSFFISYFIQNMFMSAVTDLMPVRARKHDKKLLYQRVAKNERRGQSERDDQTRCKSSLRSGQRSSKDSEKA